MKMKTKTKQQVIVIHGGESFRTHNEYISFLKKLWIDSARYRSGKKNWKGMLGAALGRRFEVIAPEMPNKLNAQYDEWKLWFLKFAPHLRRGVILVGHSLGGTFLIKYLSENTFPKKIHATLLVAPALMAGSFRPPRNLKKLEKQGGRIFLYHSRDDRVVPFANFVEYQKRLPRAVPRVFKNRGHFNQAGFPELVRDIRAVD